ncbi:MAG: NUDIX hydrolase [Pseudomonadota bacterium]
MKYCSECGADVLKRTPANDKVERFVCEHCERVFYENPTIIAGCLAEWEGKILLCKRAIEPRVGTWTIPAGFMEIGESVELAAARETLEETGATITVDALYSVFHVGPTNQVYIVYRGKMVSPELLAGAESAEVRLFEPTEIPWDELFYPAIKDILMRFVQEFTVGQFGIYMGTEIAGKVAMIDGKPTS